MATNHDKESIPEDAFRILVTGFGPFNGFKVNPSWLAVKPLHNAIITLSHEHDKAIPLSRPIHVTTLEVPTEYAFVLNTVPGVHARPPVLPLDDSITPPDGGYDFILHVGVAPPGPFRVERLGHKSGYTKKDASGELAPIADQTEALTEQKESSDDESKEPLRGFATGYETFPDVLATDLDVDNLVKDLQQSGTAIQTSDDAGRYVCDFIYYCSLAESRRTLYDNPLDNKNNTTQVLFLHCCPVGQPFTTEVTEGIKRIVVWVCNELQAGNPKSPRAATL